MGKLELVESGRISICRSYYGRTDIYLGLGKFPVGYPDSWTDTPPVVSEVTDPDLIDEFGIQATELLEEIGRRRISLSAYVIPDEFGDISIEGTTYSVSTDPTKYLYMKFILDPTDGGSEELCQVAIFTDVIPLGSVPPGQFWIIPSEIDDPGDMFKLENVPVFNLDVLKKGYYEIVQEF